MTPTPCPVCGAPALERVEGTRPVCDPTTGRDFGWSQRIVTFRHPDVACVIPTGCAFNAQEDAS
jgi:hypothetical protein